MADGRTHEAWGLGLGGGLALALWPLDGGAALAFGAGAALGTLFLNPDLDHPRSRPTRRWGPLSLLWAPYRLLFPHRGASHAWLTGPLSRALYLALLFLLLREGARGLGLPPPPPPPQDLLLPLGAGWLQAEWTHLALDRIPLRRLLR